MRSLESARVFFFTFFINKQQPKLRNCRPIHIQRRSYVLITQHEGNGGENLIGKLSMVTHLDTNETGRPC